jgi:hypothetical protein
MLYTYFSFLKIISYRINYLILINTSRRRNSVAQPITEKAKFLNLVIALLVTLLTSILGRLADLAMLALLATTGLVLLYLVIGGIGNTLRKAPSSSTIFGSV